MYTNAEQAIARSISHNEIVHIDASDPNRKRIEDILVRDCEGSVKNGEVNEYWGVIENGDDWRIHVAVPEATQRALAALDADPENETILIRGKNDDGTDWCLRRGDRVAIEADECDEDSADEGRIVRFDSMEIAVVAWDSGVTTPVDVARLTSL